MDRGGLDTRSVMQAVAERRSIRSFLDRPVSQSIIEDLLGAAARAPSGNNTQPWSVHVVTGDAKQRLTAGIMAQRSSGTVEPAMEYPYYPETWPQPYLDRRRAVGWKLYQRLGIAKGDRAGARAWHDRNFDFFGAPVGIIVTVDRRLGSGALIDVGMFLQGFAICARAHGLETCAQAAFASYHDIIRSILTLPGEQMVVCGMALGHEAVDARVNSLRTDREQIRDFATFHR